MWRKLRKCRKTRTYRSKGTVAYQRFSFQWHCKEGIITNIQKIRSEFNQSNQLKANRILIQGPPAVGKSFLGQQLSKNYNIPLINIQEVLNMIDGLEEEIQNEIKEALEA